MGKVRNEEVGDTGDILRRQNFKCHCTILFSV
jgi:hypothetical protein